MDSRSRLKLVALLLAWFALTRVILFWLGVTLPESMLQVDRAWNVEDMNLLRTDLLRTLWFDHTQPPLHNFMLGVLLKIAPAEAFGTVATSLMILLSAVLLVALLELLCALRVRPKIAAGICAIYALSPALISYGLRPLPTLPTAILLVLLALAVVRVEQGASARWLWLALGSAGLLCLVRATYHLAFLLLVIGYLAQRRGWRAVIAPALVPLVLVTGLYAKNQALFGFFGASSWMGMNMFRTLHSLSPEEKACAIAKTGDNVVGWSSFTALPFYKNLSPPLASSSPYAHPALTQAYKSDDPARINFNQWQYVEISRRYRDAFVSTVLCAPRTYATTVLRALFITAVPAEEWYGAAELRAPIEPFARAFDRVALGSSQLFFPIRHGFLSTAKREALEGGLVIYAFIGWAALVWIALALRRDALGSARWPRPALWLLLSVILYHVGVSTLLEFGENMRFRFDWEPLMLAIIAATLLGDRLSQSDDTTALSQTNS